MDKYTSRILNRLIDKYEGSKTFIGDNRVTQSFSLYIAKEFPRYMDDSDYDTFEQINCSIRELERENLVSVRRKSNGIYTAVILNETKLNRIYACLQRTPKIEETNWLDEVFENLIASAETNPVLKAYAQMQQTRIKKNIGTEFYSGNKNEFLDILKAVQFCPENKTERFIRDVSIELYRDSKRLEQIQSKVQTLLYRYGDFAERESALEELGIVRTPTYIMMKGNALITIGRQELCLHELEGDIAFSTKTVEEISDIRVLGEKVVTIENLTSFHDYNVKEDFCIYLGGFHNQLKQKVIIKLYSRNPEKKYFHFGDIDAGGFYIYEHLVRKTGIDFKPIHMDIETLEENRKAWKLLTENDRRRLTSIKENERFAGCRGVIGYMLENNCKLEQEAVIILPKII